MRIRVHKVVKVNVFYQPVFLSFFEIAQAIGSKYQFHKVSNMYHQQPQIPLPMIFFLIYKYDTQFFQAATLKKIWVEASLKISVN